MVDDKNQTRKSVVLPFSCKWVYQYSVIVLRIAAIFMQFLKVIKFHKLEIFRFRIPTIYEGWCQVQSLPTILGEDRGSCKVVWAVWRAVNIHFEVANEMLYLEPVEKRPTLPGLLLPQ